MAIEKGKGRASDEEPLKQSDEQRGEPQGDSFLSQVATSASGLARSAFSAPGGNELSGLASAALANTGKYQGPSSSTNHSASEERLVGQSSSPVGGRNAFRLSHSEEHARQSENEFSSFLNGIDSFTSSEGEPFSNKTASTWEDVSDLPAHTETYQYQPLNSSGVADQQARDGDDVITLLSQPHPSERFSAPVEPEEINWGLSPEQKIQIRGMLREMFPGSGNTTDAEFTSRLFPDASVDEGVNRKQWLELTSYTDDVWGELMPMIVSARQEMLSDGMEGNITPQKSNALRRLERILAHLRQ